MKTRIWLSLALALALVACGAPPQLTPQAPAPILGGGGGATALAPGVRPDGEIYPTSNHYRVLQAQELPLVGVTVDSQVSSLPGSRIIDGDLSTQWANGGYSNPTAWAAVQLSASANLGSIAIKTGTSPAGTSYDVQVSQDGSGWTTVLPNQSNTTWGLESKTLPPGTTGQYVRIFWHNSPSNPVPHFSIFELVVNGTPGVTPSPTPSPSPSPMPSPSPSTGPSPSPVPSFPPGTLHQLTPISVSATSTYNGLTPDRAVDGDLSTQWASGNYQSYSESFIMQFDQVYGFDHLAIKTGYLPAGVAYYVESSNDGVKWNSVSGGLTNTTWEMESKVIAGQGKYLRISFANAPDPIARFSIYEVAVYGKSQASFTTQTLHVNGQNNVVFFKNAVAVGGPIGNIINVEMNAYENTSLGLKFPSMIGVTEDDVGIHYGRITGVNAQYWYGGHGNPGPVAFLDSVNGLSDNSGSWVFAQENSTNGIVPTTADAVQNVTSWDSTKVAYLDLGSTTRTWNLSGSYDNNFNTGGSPPAVILVYTRPDGVRDFTWAIGDSEAGLAAPTTFQTQGYVYAFFLTLGSLVGDNATLTLTSLN